MPSQNNLSGAAASLLEFDSSIPYNIFKRNLKLLRAGQVVVDFNIILDNNKVIFYGPPDKDNSRTVRGKVRLEVAGRLLVKEIMITLAGEYHITNENTTSIPDENLQGTLFSTCILLANKRPLTPGIHEFFFEFLLPGDLPESMNSDLILCEYYLKAELISKGPDNSLLSSTQNKLVDLVDLSVQRSVLQSDENIRQGLSATRYTGSIDKILDYEFLIPKIIRLNTDTLTFHARWDGLRVDNVKFWFIRTENFKKHHDDDDDTTTTTIADHKTKIISGPFSFDLPKKEPLKLQSRPMVFQLPIIEPLIRDYDLNNVEIRHKLVVSIQMANKTKELIPLSIPIMVESIIDSLDLTPPSSPSPSTTSSSSRNNKVALLHFANKIYSGKSLEDNNQNQSPSYSSSTSTSSSATTTSFKRFIRAERRKSAVVDQNSLSTTTTTKAESYEQSTFQASRKTRSRRSSNNNNVSIINVQNSISTIIESASEFDESSNENSNTIATTTTYTNTENERNSPSFPQKGLSFVTNSGNVIAEKLNKFNGLIRNKSNTKKRRTSRASSSASTVRFAPGLIEYISARPNDNIPNINNTSLTT